MTFRLAGGPFSTMAAARPTDPSTAIVCDVGRLDPDLVALDTLARLRLATLRLGRPLELRNVSVELLELVAFAGLAGPLGVEVGRQPEEREQRLGVEEERELGDPSA